MCSSFSRKALIFSPFNDDACMMTEASDGSSDERTMLSVDITSGAFITATAFSQPSSQPRVPNEVRSCFSSRSISPSPVMADSEPLVQKEEGPSFFKNPCTYLYKWFWESPMDSCFFLLIIGGGVASMVIGIMQVRMYLISILGGLAIAAASNRVWTLRNLAAEIDRFAVENERLEATETRLKGEVEFLEQKSTELAGHLTNLEGTVTDLQGVSEGLQSELEQFQNLKGNIEKFAAETGADVKNILGEANKIHAKMERMTNQNERALLGKIAQDVEFLDKDAGMQKAEFDDFFSRMPQHLQQRFKDIGLTFEKVAGDDGVVDFLEIEDMINKLMEETTHKIDSISV